MWKIKSGEIEYKINAFKQKPKRARKVVKYNENGEFICEYETIENAVKDANISRGTLMKYIANKIKSPNGFIWRFKDNNNLQNIDVSNFVSKSKQSIPVLKCNLQGDVLQEFPTIASASKETGVSRTHIYNSLAGRGRKIDDYNWKFKY